MPELPELEALAEEMDARTRGRAVARADVRAVAVLKTYDPPLDALGGLEFAGVQRRGKYLDAEIGGLHLVLHLARAGRVRLADRLPSAAPRPGKGPLALRIRLDDGSGFDVTEAGTQKRLAVWLVHDPAEVPGLADLGAEPLAPDFGAAALGALLNGRRTRIKGVLRDQKLIAGIGNAYSDEILHAARISPFALAADLGRDEVDRLSDAIRSVLGAALERARAAAGDRAAAGRRAMRVHGRTGQACPVCGDTVREVSYADSSLQYCPTCQTGGRILADRRMSRLLK
ncbi:Fpg/Nei family DNA glycosylase [Nocardiopsis coralliicola]